MSKDSTYKARMLGLPEIASADDLAFQLRLPLETIQSYAKRSWSAGYKSFLLPKKPNGHREIHAPVRELKYIQIWILRNILSHLISSRYSTAFESGNTILDNASRHIGQSYIVNIDLKNFFPSIGADKVFQLFSSIGYSKDISWLLTNLVTFRGALPQGSPASPKIANLICHRLDSRIAGYCQRKNMIFSRYADDITISMSNRVHIKGSIRFLDYVATAEGFHLRKEKTSVFGRKKSKIVTGLIVSDEVRIGRKKYREMRSMIFNALKNNDLEAIKYIDGYMNFVQDVDKKTYKILYFYYNRCKENIQELKVTLPKNSSSTSVAH